MIEIDRLVAGVELIVAQGKALLQAQLDRQTVCAVRNGINGGQPLAAFAIRSLRLVGGQCAAP